MVRKIIEIHDLVLSINQFKNGADQPRVLPCGKQPNTRPNMPIMFLMRSKLGWPGADSDSDARKHCKYDFGILKYENSRLCSEYRIMTGGFSKKAPSGAPVHRRSNLRYTVPGRPSSCYSRGLARDAGMLP